MPVALTVDASPTTAPVRHVELQREGAGPDRGMMRPPHGLVTRDDGHHCADALVGAPVGRVRPVVRHERPLGLHEVDLLELVSGGDHRGRNAGVVRLHQPRLLLVRPLRRGLDGVDQPEGGLAGARTLRQVRVLEVRRVAGATRAQHDQGEAEPHDTLLSSSLNRPFQAFTLA